MTPLRDADARLHALTTRDRSLLIEAGAGSGKTSLMAGRIARLLADGEPPASIAAITFTDAAAARLGNAVQTLVEDLLEGRVDVSVAPAFPDGVDDAARANLRAAAGEIDALTTSTIHGFARALALPYPVEAGIDPGARVLDADAADTLFDEVVDGWLRDRFGEAGDEDDPLVRWLVGAPGSGAHGLRTLAGHRRHHRDAHPPDANLAAFGPYLSELRDAVAAFEAELDRWPFVSPQASERRDVLRAILDDLDGFASGADDLAPGDVVDVALALNDERMKALRGTNGVKQYHASKWKQAAVAAGAKEKDGQTARDATHDALHRVEDALAPLLTATGDALVAVLWREVGEVVGRYEDAKRALAGLDYDDLLHRAAALLRDHEPVRAALADRWRHVLVDEFQDTDPLQAEIVWRLTGTPTGDDWRDWPARPGARFVVGDPKQSIYRFRGADVRTYTMLKARMADDPGADLLEIGTNFRSVPGILTFTNDVFAKPMGADARQPDYAPLDPFHADAPDAPPAVATLPLALASERKPSAKGWADAVRATEARRVADLCAAFLDPHAPEYRPGLAARDVALLAPVGTDLERYERELEARGIAVASQAGKNYYLQQVVFDLLALGRTLVDPADTLALGALLRGPLIGVPDAALLDAQAALDAATSRPGPLRIDTDPDVLPAGPVRDALARLAPLARDAATRAPYAALRDAVDALDVRATLRARNPRHAGRDLANLDAFLDGARAYAARGLHAYVRATWRDWNDAERTREAERDAVEDAVALITVHAAKGLEWRVVIPVNTFGASQPPKPPHVTRDGVLAHKLLGHASAHYETASTEEEAERTAERLRLWYVAVTRARDTLVLPEPTFETKPSGWNALLDWPFDRLPKLDPAPAARDARPPALVDHGPDADRFAAGTAAIHAARRRVVRRAPSTHPDPERPPGAPDEADADLAPHPASSVGAGTLRGRLVHVLLEERIAGLCTDDALPGRADALHAQLAAEHPDAAADVDPREVAAEVDAAWRLPAVAELHGRLLAEVDVHGAGNEHDEDGEREVLVSGIADAVAVDEQGRVTTVVDWKSDRDASETTRTAYREQVRGYLTLLGADEGLLVFTATGEVERVTPAGA